MTAYNEKQQAYIKRLQWLIEDNSIKMAVVDYLGRVDADGMVDEKTELARRFGTRDANHVTIYGLKVVSWNKAGKKAGL